MTHSDIRLLRLYNQQFTTHAFSNAGGLIDWFGAVQSQDYAAAKWGLGLRLPQLTDADIDLAFDSGEILRTHIMRPTWHFVSPEDIRWMQQLTAPRVMKILRSSGAKLGLDEAKYQRTNKLIEQTLCDNNYLTRSEIECVLAGSGIATGDLHMVHIMMRAELDCLICSGPRRGKQFTYALLDERAPKVASINRDEALIKLTTKYFTSHGPATIADFSWWSGLTLSDAKAGVEMIKQTLQHESVDGQAYWYAPQVKEVVLPKLHACFIPNYDEYTVAYKDRSMLFDAAKSRATPREHFIFNNVVVLNGSIVAGWKRTLKKDRVELEFNYYHALDKAKLKVVEKAAEAYGKFLELPVVMTTVA